MVKYKKSAPKALTKGDCRGPPESTFLLINVMPLANFDGFIFEVLRTDSPGVLWLDYFTYLQVVIGNLPLGPATISTAMENYVKSWCQDGNH